MSPSDVVRAGSEPIPNSWPDPEPVPEEERRIISGEGKEHFDST